MRARLPITLTTLLLLSGCGSDGNNPAATGGSGSGGNGATGATAAGGQSSAGTAPLAGGGGQAMAGSGGGQVGPVFAGADCPADVGFPSATAIANVQGSVSGGNVRISFDPQADAKDYRVYVLPKAGDVTADSVQGAVYRCAGHTAVPFPAQDDSKIPENPGVRTRVASSVQGYARTQDDATLGYVFTAPAADRLPVYVLGEPSLKSDNVDCYYMRWQESRVKRYTTSETERTQLLDEHWRDDGIAFYVPKPETAGTAPVSAAQNEGDMNSGPLYLAEGAEQTERSGKSFKVEAAFSVFTEAQLGSEPLMRVYYEPACGHGHDELAAGEARFTKNFEQGAQPVTELHFSGLSEETTLVVEALDELCPFQGIVAPSSRPARVDPFQDFEVNYPAFQTPDELATASASGEVFINGQGEATAPHALGRTCLKVKPSEPAQADWRYDGAPQTFSEPVQHGFQIWEVESPTFNVQYHTVATDEWSIGGLFGELWATYGDWAADTNGKLRITPKERATLSPDKFVHATMEVDTVSTQRRYPQILISDAEWPVQDNLVNGHTVLVQMFGGITEPMGVQVQFCDLRTWDVNNQCPMWDVYHLGEGDQKYLSPQPEINGYSGVDRTVQFDLYASTSRAYVLANGKPYACVDLPADRLVAGPATVTFGDVLYHSGVDLADWYPFHLSKMHNVTSRHFSNLAFSSNVAPPEWDEARIPCVVAGVLK